MNPRLVIAAALLFFAQGCNESKEETSKEATKPNVDADDHKAFSNDFEYYNRYCVPTSWNYSLQRWEKFADTIIVGRVIEAQTRYKLGAYGNRCWSRVQVIESVKGLKQEEVWVQAFYPHMQRLPSGGYKGKDREDIKNCPLQAGQEYIIFANNNYVESPYYPSAPYLSTGVPDADYTSCLPLLPREGHQDILNALKGQGHG